MSFEMEQKHVAVSLEATTLDFWLSEKAPPIFEGRLHVNNGHLQSTVLLTLDELEDVVVGFRKILDDAKAALHKWKRMNPPQRKLLAQDFNRQFWGEEDLEDGESVTEEQGDAQSGEQPEEQQEDH